MRECLLLFINNYGTNKGGLTYTSKDSLTKKHIVDF